MHGSRAFSLAIVLSMAALACSTPKPEPEIASSATEPGYAQDYPEAMAQISKDFGRDDDDAKTLSGKFSTYPNELKAPDWAVTGDIYTAADQAGKSRAYVERTRETQGAAAFYAQEKEDIVKKVGGAATYASKQKGCEADLTGTVSHSLDEIMGKKIEERMREKNEAHQILDRNRTILGKDNVAALQKQADDISRASYLVNIAMVEEKVRLEAMIEEAEQIKKTLDDYIAKERAFQGKAKDEDKKDSDARIERARKAQGQVDASIGQGNELVKQMNERIQEAQKRHNESVGALKSDVQGRAKQAGQSS
jgi:hypothetical protein